MVSETINSNQQYSVIMRSLNCSVGLLLLILEHSCSEYQVENFLRINSFTALLTLTSRGCKRSVKLAGTMTTCILLSDNNCNTVGVHWPLNLSNRTRAEWLDESESFHVCLYI